MLKRIRQKRRKKKSNTLNNFYTRTLTGAGIVLFILGGFWLHPYTFFVAGLILLIGCMVEYYQLIMHTGARPQVVAGIFTGTFVYIISTFVARSQAYEWLFLLLAFVPLVMAGELFRKQPDPFGSLSSTVFPVIYIALPFSLFPFSAWHHTGLKALIDNTAMSFSPGLVIGFFIIIWANDTGAYLTGITFGRHKMLERISPKKTWEGFIGGLLLSSVAAILLSGWLGITGKTGWIIIALIICVAGTVGDLAESMLKRSTGVKDSGSIMPGHGGFLDRFDSTLMAFPIVYLFVSLFGRF